MAYDECVRTALGLVVLAGCNAVFDLRTTELTPPDVDGDGIDDRVDDCPITPDPEQLDADGDGFGDACDFCPNLATAVNHDEDGDLRGDECDQCPMAADFPVNEDGDGVGDACDFDLAADNRILGFDAFLSLGAWQATGTPWRTTGDAIVVSAQPPADDPGLVNPPIILEGSRGWQIRFGLTSTETWTTGDTFGIAFIDVATGKRVATCMLACTTDCALTITTPDLISTAQTVTPEPVTELRFEYYPNFQTCRIGFVGPLANTVFPTVTPVLIGSPKVHLRYFAAWQ